MTTRSTMNLNVRRVLRRAVIAASALPLLGAATAMAAPALDVSPTIGLDPAGATLDVSGTDFSATIGNQPGVGFYAGQLAIVDGTSYFTYNAGGRWVSASNPDAPSMAHLETDGTFDTTVGVKAQFTGTGSTAVDCAAANTDCFVASWPAHGAATAANVITKVPIEFGPSLAVTPTVDLDPAGATLDVSGAGFSATIGNQPGTGFYAGQLAIVDGTSHFTYNAGGRWVSATNPDAPSMARLQPDGTFDTTVGVVAQFTGTGSTAVDCRAANTDCFVASWPAHG
ncbi:MAG TPA: hypothetical protein VIL49_13150, partial [Capillimicrobium sp.]